MDIAVIAGTSLIGSDFFASARLKRISVAGSRVAVFVGSDAVFLPRHGVGRHIMPHLINHAANFRALAKLGVKRVVAINCVGSLKRSITPGHYVVPDDYIGLWTPTTVFDSGERHVMPGLDAELRRALCRAVRAAGLPLVPRGVYVQTPGPRFETRAEVAMLAKFGDVVGMTMASEATVARELDMAYASLCVVDNYANGVVSRPLTLELVKESAKRKIPILIGLINKLLKTLAR